MIDPIVEEVRRAREKILQQFGGDLRAYLAYLSEQERQHPERVIDLETWRRRRQNKVSVGTPPIDHAAR